jgi:hypothetical protein
MIGKVSDKITPSKANKDISIWERWIINKITTLKIITKREREMGKIIALR